MKTRTVRLAPVRHEAPECVAYADEVEVRRFEIATRIHRAHVEEYTVTAIDFRVDGAYRVVGRTGSSGEERRVDIVDRSALRDTCDCPDFLGNDLGTCKHLEAVRRAISRVPELRRGYLALGEVPRAATLTVATVGGARLIEAGPWTARLRARLGLIRDAEVDAVRHDVDAPLLPGWREPGLRVVHAAPRLAEQLRARRASDARRAAVASALHSGRARVDLLTVPLFPYQAAGASHLAAAGRALLADDMGLGKTVQAIAACELLRARGEAARVLVVTCASLKHQWQKEIERFAGEHAVVVGGGKEGRRAAFESDAPYKILNYEQTWRELAQIRALDADVVVYDEAQRAKNFRTKTAATLRSIPARFTFVLTGTPVENRLDDLYALLQLVDPALLGPLWRFNLDFARQNERGRIVGYQNLGELRRRIAPLVLRRRKEDVLSQLPALTEQTRYTAMTPEQVELEEGHRVRASQLLRIAERRPLTKPEQDRLMMSLLKARQACDALELCDPKSRVRASPKLDELEALLGEILAQGSAKALVFSEWVEMLKLAGQRLDRLGIGYAMLHGGVPTDKRPALLERFRSSDDVRVLLSTEAGGVGLNLQVASYVVHLDLPWNPARLDQRTSRAHRMGQTRGVTVTYLCAEQGIERGIEGVLASKRAVRGAALDATSGVESLETPSFNATLNQVRDILDQLEEPGSAAEVQELTEALQPTPASGAGDPPLEAPEAPAVAPPPRRGEGQARARLRLARVVLDAGFPGDAVRAAYEGLAAAIAGLLDTPPDPGHGALVAAVYRELLPAGRLPGAAHAALAMLHDLATLEAHGIEVAAELASRAVEEAEQWTARLAAVGPASDGARTPRRLRERAPA
ncbi:MAG: DEAD/DEAH box helicase [Polyangiaceae bacterium]|nr:DEAD/DEAH box helicase [Polyangiaceae bacterium]